MENMTPPVAGQGSWASPPGVNQGNWAPSTANQGNWNPPSGADQAPWAPPAQPAAPPTGSLTGAEQAPWGSPMPSAGVEQAPWAPSATPEQAAWAPPAPTAPPEPASSFTPPSGNTPLANTPLANTPLANTPLIKQGPTIIDTSSGRSDGLNRCPKCGATDISIQPGTGMLQCSFCRNVFELGQREGPADANLLRGEKIGSGAANITQPDYTHVTMKCQGCGAEVVINVDETMTARCHWCRHLLSLENQIPNGAVPDMVLPFILSRQQAQAKIEEFVKKRQFFAHPRFRKEFTTENILGVYLPYLVVDANTHSDMQGYAGHVARSYTVGSGKNQHRVYDIDIYNIGRNFDLLIDDLTVEASSARRDINRRINTNNIINSIMPFDVQNSVPYNGNYLKGFSSERRDTNIDDVRGLAYTQLADIARFQAGKTTSYYDAGVVWTTENTAASGMLWKAAYLPVWLYSYYEKKSDGNHILHYVSVNARTGETMGSVPLNTARLLGISAIIEAGALLLSGLLAIAIMA